MARKTVLSSAINSQLTTKCSCGLVLIQGSSRSVLWDVGHDGSFQLALVQDKKYLKSTKDPLRKKNNNNKFLHHEMKSYLF